MSELYPGQFVAAAIKSDGLIQYHPAVLVRVFHFPPSEEEDDAEGSPYYQCAYRRTKDGAEDTRTFSVCRPIEEVWPVSAGAPLAATGVRLGEICAVSMRGKDFTLAILDGSVRAGVDLADEDGDLPSRFYRCIETAEEAGRNPYLAYYAVCRPVSAILPKACGLAEGTQQAPAPAPNGGQNSAAEA